MHNMYAEAAPLPVALVDHLFRRFAQSRPGVPDLEKESLFISLVNEKRRAAFAVLSPYVQVSALTRTWLIDRLAEYDHPIAPRTFAYWIENNRVSANSTGKILPLSAQSVLIAGMIDNRKREFLPSEGVPADDTWHCYVQRDPGADVEVWPVSKFHELPAATLCWTPSASAGWVEGWHLLGEAEGNIGCMRFVGTKHVNGNIWYDVSLADIRRWDAAVADLYVPSKGNTLAPLQHLCNLLFDRLAVKRLG